MPQHSWHEHDSQLMLCFINACQSVQFAFWSSSKAWSLTSQYVQCTALTKSDDVFSLRRLFEAPTESPTSSLQTVQGLAKIVLTADAQALSVKSMVHCKLMKSKSLGFPLLPQVDQQSILLMHKSVQDVLWSFSWVASSTVQAAQQLATLVLEANAAAIYDMTMIHCSCRVSSKLANLCSLLFKALPEASLWSLRNVQHLFKLVMSLICAGCSLKLQLNHPHLVCKLHNGWPS